MNILNPNVISCRRERVVGGGEGHVSGSQQGGGGMQEHFMYRLIVRTSELLPLRLDKEFKL